MLDFPELFVPKKTVIGASFNGPVSLQPLKFCICKRVSMDRLEKILVFPTEYKQGRFGLARSAVGRFSFDLYFLQRIRAQC